MHCVTNGRKKNTQQRWHKEVNNKEIFLKIKLYNEIHIDKQGCSII